MASRIQWTYVWVNSGSWWWTGRPGMLRFMGSQTVGHEWDWTELNWTDTLLQSWAKYYIANISFILLFSNILISWSHTFKSHLCTFFNLNWFHRYYPETSFTNLLDNLFAKALRSLLSQLLSLWWKREILLNWCFLYEPPEKRWLGDIFLVASCIWKYLYSSFSVHMRD